MPGLDVACNDEQGQRREHQAGGAVLQSRGVDAVR
jgi:hypothetical protein